MKNICLLHGWGSDIEKLTPLKLELKKLGWQVYLPALPFFDAPEAKRPWQVADFARFINTRCRRHFKDQAYYLFGHSFGGRIAIKIGSGNPKYLKGLILCSAAGLSRSSLIKRLFFIAISKLFSPLKSIPTLFLLSRRIIYRLAHAHDYYTLTSKNKIDTFKLVIKEDLLPLVPLIKSPALILWGTKDKLTPVSDAIKLNRILPHSRLKLYKNYGHRLPYDQPAKLAQEINLWIR